MVIDSLQIVALQEYIAEGMLGDSPAELLNITSNNGTYVVCLDIICAFLRVKHNMVL